MTPTEKTRQLEERVSECARDEDFYARQACDVERMDQKMNRKPGMVGRIEKKRAAAERDTEAALKALIEWKSKMNKSKS